MIYPVSLFLNSLHRGGPFTSASSPSDGLQYGGLREESRRMVNPHRNFPQPSHGYLTHHITAVSCMSLFAFSIELIRLQCRADQEL